MTKGPQGRASTGTRDEGERVRPLRGCYSESLRLTGSGQGLGARRDALLAWRPEFYLGA